MSKIVTAKELAQILKVQTATVHSWHRRGLIPCLRAGHRPVLFELDEVIRAMKTRADNLRDENDGDVSHTKL